jgi:hypothetical protein
MQMPPADPDTLFEELLQDLPPATTAMARECKAFVRAKKVKTPQQLLRAVFLYCGLDKSLRETAAPSPSVSRHRRVRTWCAAMSMPIGCRRHRPTRPANGSVRRVGRKAARPKRRHCFGPDGSSSSPLWPPPCSVPRPSAHYTV